MNRCYRLIFFYAGLFAGVLPSLAQSNFGQGPIVIKILEGENTRVVQVSRDQIFSMPVDSARGRSMPGEPEQTWMGASLRSVLTAADINIKKLRKLVVAAPDGYVSVLTGKRLHGIETGVCAYAISGEAVFPENFGGLRLIFPDQRGMYWVNSPNKMVAHVGPPPKTARSFRLYGLSSPTVKRVLRQGPNGERIRMAGLLKRMAPKAESFHVLSRDSLWREYEAGKLVAKMRLDAWEDSTWSIGGQGVPEGLKTLDLFYFQVGSHGLILKTMNAQEEALWMERVIVPRIGRDADRAEIAVTVVKKDGYRHPSMLQRHWIGGKWTLARLLAEEYQKTDGLDFLEMTW